MATYRELVTQANQLMTEAELVRKREIDQVINDIREKMTQYGLTLRDISTPELKAASSRAPAPPKYRSPQGQLWAGGRGRKPDWVRAVLAAGEDLEKYRI
jgi:DNA-binding protein H-NS